MDSAGFRSQPVLQRIQGLLDEYRARTSTAASTAPHNRAADVVVPPAPAPTSSQVLHRQDAVRQWPPVIIDQALPCHAAW